MLRPATKPVGRAQSLSTRKLAHNRKAAARPQNQVARAKVGADSGRANPVKRRPRGMF